MLEQKTRFISDNLHGSIPFSSLIEKPILADPLFNRLQGIKQNSTAFKTYPALEHSRFIHSLGVMHLTSQIFYHALLNADKETALQFTQSFKSYFQDIIKQTKTILQNDSFIDRLFARIGRATEDVSRSLFQNQIEELLSDGDLKKFEKIFEGDRVFALFSPHRIENEHYIINCILLQAIRICALFHDLGHPPFSHAVEFAVQDFYRKYKTQEPTVSKNQKKFFEIIGFYLDYIKTNMGFSEKKPFHESVTLIFIQNIFDNIITLYWENEDSSSDEDKIFFTAYSYLIRFLVLSIDVGHPLVLNESASPVKLDSNRYVEAKNLGSAFLALQSVISGDIDADRLDYVMRDTENSGFSSYSFNISRIVNHFILYSDEVGFRFLTSIRSLNDTEKFLRERLSVYRYIIFHHNVVKTDLVLSKILEYVFKLTVLEKDQEGHFDHWKYFWEYLDTKHLHEFDLVGAEKFNLHASAWNEDWLMSAMNISYQLIYSKKIHNKTISATESKLYLLLREFIYNKRNLLSIWKRHISFMQFSHIFSERIVREKNTPDSMLNELLRFPGKITGNSESNPKDTYLENKIVQLNKLLSQIQSIEEKKDIYTDAKEKSRLVKSILEILYYLDKDVEDKLELGISNKLEKEFGMKFAVYFKNIEKRLKSGVSNKCYIGIQKEHSPEKIECEKLGSVSSIIDELEQAVLFSPQFHLYLAEIRTNKLIKTNKITLNNIGRIFDIIIDTIIEELYALSFIKK